MISVCTLLSVVCLSVCPSQKAHIQISLNFLRTSLRSCLGPPLTAMQYVTYFRFCSWRYVFTMFLNRPENQRRRVCFVQFARWRHRGRCLPSPTASCFIVMTVSAFGWALVHRITNCAVSLSDDYKSHLFTFYDTQMFTNTELKTEIASDITNWNWN